VLDDSSEQQWISISGMELGGMCKGDGSGSSPDCFDQRLLLDLHAAHQLGCDRLYAHVHLQQALAHRLIVPKQLPVVVVMWCG